MAESGPGTIYYFEDFMGAEIPVANAVAYGTSAGGCNYYIGSLKVTGKLGETDAGVVSLANGLGGVARLTSTNEDGEICSIGTEVMFDVALMAPLVLETRVQMQAIATRNVYIGFTDVNADAQTAHMTGATTTLSLTDSDLCGFHYDSSLTSANWHMPYNGGTTTGPTTSTSVVSGVTPVAGEWDILKVVIYSNGTAEWFINGASVQKVANAVSTTVDLAAVVSIASTTTTAVDMDVDYILIQARRDWTR